MPIRFRTIIAVALALLAGLAPPAQAERTDVRVTVLSKGGKFVGTSMGGVKVTLRDARSGKVLAEGVVKGSTGDTEKIMKAPQPRWEPVHSEGAGAFTATLDLDEPTLVRAEAYGPLAQRQSAITVTAEQWVVPGKPITAGDGWLLEMPGLVVDVLSPAAPSRVDANAKSVPVQVNVAMMCGCPITPGGLWDADKFEVQAIVKRDGKTVATIPLKFAGKASQFAGEVPVEGPGDYELAVYAYQPANGNTGVDKATFVVDKPKP